MGAEGGDWQAVLADSHYNQVMRQHRLKAPKTTDGDKVAATWRLCGGVGGGNGDDMKERHTFRKPRVAPSFDYSAVGVP